MNAKDAVQALKSCERHHILILTDAEPHGFVHGQPCICVQDLPPDQRQPNQGNVILWDGRFTTKGLQSGGTFWAKDVHSIHWVYNTVARIYTHNTTRISIMKLWKISSCRHRCAKTLAPDNTTLWKLPGDRE